MASRTLVAAFLAAAGLVAVGCSAGIVSGAAASSEVDLDATAVGPYPPGPEAAVFVADAGSSTAQGAATDDASDGRAGEGATDGASSDELVAEADAASDVATPVLHDGNPSSDDGSSGDGGGPPVPRGPTWANWPMPNPASSGLPNPASYDTSMPGIVLDKVTGLMWEAADHFGYGSMQAAAGYCTELRLGGFTDWRLPARIEVWSIQDFTHFAPALAPVFSTLGTDSNRVAPWTSTPGHGQFLYDGNFYTSQDVQSVGAVDGFASAPLTTVRCVRGSTAQPDPHYTISGGTVFDHGTKLTWQQEFDFIPSLPNGVANYCSSLAVAGGGWRAPSVTELESIVDDLLIEPALDKSVFHYPASGTGNLVFWSSSPWAGAPQFGESLYVDFHDGSNGTGDNSIPVPPLGGNNNFYQVRCVK